MDKKLITVFSLLAVAGIAALGATEAMAYMGDPSVKGPNYNEEIHTQMQEAIENRDYESWIQIREENNLPMKGKMFQVMNEENFEQFVQLKEAMINGDDELANQIREELGVGMGHRHMAKFGPKESFQFAGKLGNCPVCDN